MYINVRSFFCIFCSCFVAGAPVARFLLFHIFCLYIICSKVIRLLMSTHLASASYSDFSIRIFD